VKRVNVYDARWCGRGKERKWENDGEHEIWEKERKHGGDGGEHD